MLLKFEGQLRNTDSANGIIIAKSKTTNNSVRWLNNRFFFIRDIYTNGDMKLEKIDGHVNPADGLTKALHKDKFEAFQRLIGMEILKLLYASELSKIRLLS